MDQRVVAAGRKSVRQPCVERRFEPIEAAVADVLRLRCVVREHDGLNQIVHVAIEDGAAHAQPALRARLPTDLEIRGALGTQVEMIYVSPLKALSNDVRQNLEAPLHEISRLAGIAPGTIRTRNPPAQ